MFRIGVVWFAWLFLEPSAVFGAPVDDFDYPTDSGVVTCDFNVTCAARNHLGVDLRARAGDAIYAPANGVVREAQSHRRYGATVIIEHQLGSAEDATSVIGHMRLADLAVRVGDVVSRGQVIGYAGTRAENGGWAPHIHWGVKRGLYSSSSTRCGSGSEWAYAGYTNCPETVVPRWYDPIELVERIFSDPTLTDDDGDTLTESEGDCDDTNSDIYPGAVESCDGVDEDCDSETDEDWPLLGTACTVRPTPLCERAGLWICEPLHRGAVCDADYEIRDELCNGFDDNCNGETDEDWPLLGVACEAGFGECRSSGVWECEPYFGGSICSAEIGRPSPELCDNMDNDCDGTTDEDWPELGTICGIFPCDGTYICSLGGSGSYCNSSPGMPEVCDGLDNDCDTEIDETPAELACADTSACTEDVCLFGLCQNVARDRDGDTWADDLCGGSDCNDLNPAVWEYTFADSRLTNSVGDSNAPVVVWTGTEIGIVWEDWRAGYPNAEIYFARANTSLARISDEVRVTTAPNGSRYPSFIWTGAEYGIAWSDGRLDMSRLELYFTRLDSAGAEIGDDLRLTDHSVAPGSSYSPSLAWTGGEFGIVFQDSRVSPMGLYFIRLNPDGTPVAPETAVVGEGGSENFPTLVWTGTQYGLAHTGSVGSYKQIFFARIDPSGSRIGGVVTVAAFDSGERLYAETVDLVWQGPEFALVWTKNMASGMRGVYFRRLDTTGTPLAPEVLVVSSPDAIYNIDLTWSGSRYGLTWSETASFPARAYFLQLDEDGGTIGSQIELSNRQRVSEKITVVWTGHEYVMAWADVRDDGVYYEIYLGRIGCGW